MTREIPEVGYVRHTDHMHDRHMHDVAALLPPVGRGAEGR